MPFPYYTIPGWDFRPSSIHLWHPSTGFGFVNYLQVQDYATSLDLPRFDPAVEDADRFGERRDGRTGREGVGHGVRSRQRSTRHPVASVDVLLQFVSSG